MKLPLGFAVKFKKAKLPSKKNLILLKQIDREKG